MKVKIRRTVFLWVVLLLPYFLIVSYIAYKYCTDISKTKAAFLIISKDTMTLSIYDDNGDTLGIFNIACGKNAGNKEEIGDLRTPEGIFPIVDIQDASKWTHDFGDGKGYIDGAYGSHFIRLGTNFKGIGIHGTHDSASIGKRVTEGCIRLNNNDLLKLIEYVKVGIPVVIIPSKEDIQ
ncbi:lipoprotein-anchoring transpeptidase ErfK/SrfK [Dysgonomonas sp. PFB1-18]|uniref:L,D-transpeptidase n=1 Tax=unclassified Dysgonomonas TaxID=2630389 RepID=UPI0024756650|nr:MULTISPECIES: L,D-transpeptidase [unclassified Dysgonomonas]MDH6307408.1 lipoprotein-anchoring transpeptidase ErfK/SrfK [Dysgonomonas sp. PF1-14]MDH6337326.1 lipoprotein-anchoring transpeptidase ErfK/SrfK [Dysgonomonas sp. PF1-16]MDH6379250.1 lipoprotein-anchoring transpeptidase ErfK/SrfK [Dysgonomonas sp. PFB1-18]MDH6396112.1 lipoprotein-anchoring transpeptidase ErfK/SrfK [Dysgonomonas sp. PF1-23]